MDEGLYLWAGHLELAHWLHGTPMPPSIQPFQVYFSGAPTIYPPLGALADTYGGLAGARLLSLLFMLGATCLLYATAVTLFDRATAVAAAATFVLLAPSQLLSAFATYDPMALFLLALSSWLVVRARDWASEPLLLAAGLVMALGDATKYAAGLWNPVVLALAGITIQSGGPLRALPASLTTRRLHGPPARRRAHATGWQLLCARNHVHHIGSPSGRGHLLPRHGSGRLTRMDLASARLCPRRSRS